MERLNIVTQRIFIREDFSAKVSSTNKFVLRHEPIKDTIMVLRNGIQTRGGGSTSDYSLSGRTVTINFSTSIRTKIVIQYFYFRAGETYGVQ